VLILSPQDLIAGVWKRTGRPITTRAADSVSTVSYPVTRFRTSSRVSDFDYHARSDGSGGAQQWRYGFFFQDKWQVTSNLTLTYGLRYELPTVPQSTTGNATILNPEQTAFIPTTVPQKIPLNGPDHNNWAPRLGFAYRLPSRFVLRGGFGMYYNPNQLNSYTLMTTNPPFSTIFTYPNNIANPTLTLANPTRQRFRARRLE
jgi:outer membrane receptor protein involved in Fe transport